MKYRILVLGMLLLGFSGSTVEAACTVHRWSFYWDQESQAVMTTDGAPCRTSITWTGGTTEVQGVTISSPARNGTASASGNTVNYRPKPGFKGRDTFAFTISGRRGVTPSKAVVRVTVTVN